jgi:hemerythrin-like domain-containing protein
MIRIDGHDGELTDALASLIGYLKLGPYEGVREDVEAALHGSADRFVNRLASHLRHEEEDIFPMLLRHRPGSAPRIDALRLQHAALRAYASEFAQRLGAADRDGAAAVARSFLAALLEHVAAERHVVEELSEGLVESAGPT